MKQNHTICSLILITFILSACAPSFLEKYPNVVENFRKKPDKKALAAAYDSNGAYAYGHSSGRKTLEVAKEQALIECQARKRVNRIDSPCEIIMLNDEIVEEE